MKISGIACCPYLYLLSSRNVCLYLNINMKWMWYKPEAFFNPITNYRFFFVCTCPLYFLTNQVGSIAQNITQPSALCEPFWQAF